MWPDSRVIIQFPGPTSFFCSNWPVKLEVIFCQKVADEDILV